MIPVQDNWLHIDDKFIDSCEQIVSYSYHDNLNNFKQLGLFRLLLPQSLGGRYGHLQDLLECQLAISEHCVQTADAFIKIASAPYLIKQFGPGVLQEVFGADNNALVLLYPGTLESARTEDTPAEYDWIVVKDNERLCLLDVNNKNFLPEHRTITLQDLANANTLSWYQLYNRVLTTSAIGGLRHVINIAMKSGDKTLHAVLGQGLSEADEMALVLHRNINHALLHIDNDEVIPMYDRVKYKVQSANVWFKCVELMKNIALLTDNTEVSSVVNGVKSMNIEHLNDVKNEFTGYITYLKEQKIDDLYL